MISEAIKKRYDVCIVYVLVTRHITQWINRTLVAESEDFGKGFMLSMLLPFVTLRLFKYCLQFFDKYIYEHCVSLHRNKVWCSCKYYVHTRAPSLVFRMFKAYFMVSLRVTHRQVVLMDHASTLLIFEDSP